VAESHDLLRAMRPEFIAGAAEFPNLRHQFVEGNKWTALPLWLGEKLMNGFPVVSNKPSGPFMSRWNGWSSAEANMVFNRLASRAAVYAGLPDDSPTTWLKFIYENIRPSLIWSGSLGPDVPIRNLAIDPFTASAIVIDAVAQAVPAANNSPVGLPNPVTLRQISDYIKVSKRTLESIWRTGRCRGRPFAVAREKHINGIGQTSFVGSEESPPDNCQIDFLT
jgi:hypothetical protein